MSARDVLKVLTLPHVGDATRDRPKSKRYGFWQSHFLSSLWIILMKPLCASNANMQRRREKKRTLWCREHFLLRNTRAEFERTFCTLMTRKDDISFNIFPNLFSSFFGTLVWVLGVSSKWSDSQKLKKFLMVVVHVELPVLKSYQTPHKKWTRWLSTLVCVALLSTHEVFVTAALRRAVLCKAVL